VILIEWFKDLASLVTKQHLVNLATALFIFLIGIFIARRTSQALSKFGQLDTQQRMLLSKISYYGLIGAALAAALGQLGFDVRVLLGAAGVLTVAIGFAAQTSASNLISGLFLMVDKPFMIGDAVAIGDIRGEVTAIDLLSCKIRTFANLMVRVPNETMVKSNITNFSFFPIRRLDLTFGVPHRTDLNKVESILKKTASLNVFCLNEPSPVFIVSGFGEAFINLQFQVWTLSENLIPLQNELYAAIRDKFESENIFVPSATPAAPPVAT
jgi:small-conductance mechanosensitive channel